MGDERGDAALFLLAIIAVIAWGWISIGRCATALEGIDGKLSTLVEQKKEVLCKE